MIKSKVGWLCSNCGNLVSIRHTKAAPTAEKPAAAKKTTPKPKPAPISQKSVSDLKRKGR